MRIRLLALLLLLCVLPLQGGITSAVQVAAVGGCNAFAETTWDNLTGWTQDSNNDFSTDATNDELDLNSLSIDEIRWIYNDTTTTDANHCALWQYKDIDPATNLMHVALRVSGVGNSFYSVGFDSGNSDSIDLIWAIWSNMSSSGASWDQEFQKDGVLPDDGDYISACVTGTGTNTVVTYWDHGASDPGDCRTDWGAADFTWTDNPDNAVDSGSSVGWITNPWEGFGADDPGPQILDEFVGSDY